MDTRTFGSRESPVVEDMDVLDDITAMGLWKSQLQRLDDIREAVEPANSMTMEAGSVTLSTTAKSVLQANDGRKFAEVKNTDASISIYIGMDSGVSSVNGHLLKAGESFGFEGYGGPVWAIAASGSPVVTAIEW